MKETNVYEVAGHRFAVTADSSLLESMQNQYGPFLPRDATPDDVLFTLKVADENDLVPNSCEEDIVQDDDTQRIGIGSIGNQSFFSFWLGQQLEGRLITSADHSHSLLALDGSQHLYAMNNALMVLYMLATAPLSTLVFHSSVTIHGGKGYMFLGVSGTGKSTHSQLWLNYIEDTELLNDDNPVVRILPDGDVRVYGTPWSGKTPCYKNRSCPVGALVKLEQAPKNEIRRLRAIEAYAEVVPGISGKRWDRALADALHATEDALIQKVPVYLLRCLPDEAAAQLCCKTVSND